MNPLLNFEPQLLQGYDFGRTLLGALTVPHTGADMLNHFRVLGLNENFI